VPQGDPLTHQVALVPLVT